MGASAGLDDVAETVSAFAGVSTSPIVNATMEVPLFSLRTRSGIGEIAGKSLTEFTVKRNLVRVEPKLSSVTVIAMLAVPDRLARGVTVTVRLFPLPPNTMLASGTNAGFDEVPKTVRSSAEVPESVIVNGMAPVDAPSLTVLLPIAEIVGGAALPIGRM